MAANLYKRGLTWWGRVQVRGVEHRRSLRTPDEAVAREALKDWQASLSSSPTGPDPTWPEAVVNWSETISSMTGEDGIKPAVRKRYLDSMRQADHFWRHLRLSQIGRREIAEYVKARKKGFTRISVTGKRDAVAPITNATVRRDLTALSGVFRAAVAAGLTDRNPAREWDRSVIKERRAVIVPPTAAEITTVIRYAKGNFARLIEFAANTGVRQMEAVGLEWRDVRADRGEFILPRTKARRPRVIRLTSPGGDAAGTVAGTPRHIRSGLVFWHEIDGKPYGNPAGWFRVVMDNAVAGERAEGRELQRFRFHDLRHAFAVRWLEAGGPIYELSKHLGHTSVKTTEGYLQFVRQESEAEAESRHKAGTGAETVARTGSAKGK